MELKLQEWICQSVLQETEKLFRPTALGTNDSFRGNARSYVNNRAVHLSGARIIQIISFNGQRKGPFTNISVSDGSCQIRASLSELARKQFEKRYERRLPHMIVGGVFEISECSLLFNLDIKSTLQVTLDINNLVLKGGEGSSNLGSPIPVENTQVIGDLIARMDNTITQRQISGRGNYACSSPIRSQSESLSEEEGGSPNSYLATQAPLSSEIHNSHKNAPEKIVAWSLPPAKSLLGLIGANKKPSIPTPNMISKTHEESYPNFLSNHQSGLPTNQSTPQINMRNIHQLTAKKDATSIPVSEIPSGSSDKPVTHSKQWLPSERSVANSQGAIQLENNIPTTPVNPSGSIKTELRSESSTPIRNKDANLRRLNMPICSSVQENPWGKLTRIPLKYVTIPENQLAQLSTRESWVASIADIQSLNRNLPADVSGCSKPFNLQHVEDTDGQDNVTSNTIAGSVQSGKSRHIFDGSYTERDKKSGPQISSYRGRCTANPNDDVSREPGFMNDPNNKLDVAEVEDDDVVSWPTTSRASSIGLDPRNEDSPSSKQPLIPSYSNISSPQTVNHSPASNSFLTSPRPKFNAAHGVHLSSILPTLTNSTNDNPGNGAHLHGSNTFLTSNVIHSSIPCSEDDMEQTLPYAIGDVIQSSDDRNISRIPASTQTISSTESQQSPILQIERTPYSRSRKDQPSPPETRFSCPHLGLKQSIPNSNSSTGSIVPGTFNCDVGSDDETPGSLSTHRDRLLDNDKGHMINDATVEIAVERSASLSIPSPEHPRIPIFVSSVQQELCNEHRRSNSKQNNPRIGHTPELEGTPTMKPSNIVNARQMPETLRPLHPVPQVYDTLPSLPSSTSPTSKKIARSYIPRRERKRQKGG